MHSFRLLYKNSEVHCLRVGEGKRIVFCLHGYGEGARNFSFLEQQVSREFTLFAIDLPFHGDTIWRDGLTFSMEDLQQLIKIILTENYPAAAFASHQFSVLGYSMGGRIALSLYEEMPEQIEQLILLAPDGLIINRWYWFATQTRFGNKLFSLTMKYPGWLFTLVKLLHWLRLFNTSIFKFVNYYIGEPQLRLMLYKRWTTLRKFNPHLKLIKRLIHQNNTPVRLLYGKYDRIITASSGEKFQKGIEQQCTVTVIASGHQVLHEKNWEAIVKLLTD